MTLDLPNSPSPADLWEMDRAHSLHPWTNFRSFEKDGSLVIARGEGCYLWDAEGRQYLDAVGGMWCTNVGLGRKDMARAIADQAERLAFANSFVDVTNEPSARLSAKLAALAPGDLNRVHLTTGGSTAVDTAVRMVWYYQSLHGAAREDGHRRAGSQLPWVHLSDAISGQAAGRPGGRVPLQGRRHPSPDPAEPYRRPRG